MASLLSRVWRRVAALSPEAILSPAAPVTLFSFEHAAAADRWFTVSDAQDGGCSRAAVSHSAEDGGKLVFAGSLSTEFDGADPDLKATVQSFDGARMVRSGYCALRRQGPPPFGPLHEHHGLELVCRSDNRPYIASVRTERFLRDDQEIFQALLPPLPEAARELARSPGVLGPWRRVRLPWRSFKLTWRGFLQEHGAELDPRRIQSVGLSLVAADAAHEDMGYAGMRDGPFALELRAVRTFCAPRGRHAGGEGVEQEILEEEA